MVAAPKCVTAYEDEATEGRTHMGVFWPKWLYESHTGFTLAKEKQAKYDGEVGVVRDMSHGQPAGTTAVEKFKRRGARIESQLASSDTAIQLGHVDACWNAAKVAAGDIHVSAEKDNDDPQAEPVLSVYSAGKAAAPSNADDAEEGDWLAGICPVIVQQVEPVAKNKT